MNEKSKRIESLELLADYVARISTGLPVEEQKFQDAVDAGIEAADTSIAETKKGTGVFFLVSIGLIGILIQCGPAFWPYFERLSNIQPQFSPTDLARDARADPFVVAGFQWLPILHGFG